MDDLNPEDFGLGNEFDNEEEKKLAQFLIEKIENNEEIDELLKKYNDIENLKRLIGINIRDNILANDFSVNYYSKVKHYYNLLEPKNAANFIYMVWRYCTFGDDNLNVLKKITKLEPDFFKDKKFEETGENFLEKFINRSFDNVSHHLSFKIYSEDSFMNFMLFVEELRLLTNSSFDKNLFSERLIRCLSLFDEEKDPIVANVFLQKLKEMKKDYKNNLKINAYTFLNIIYQNQWPEFILKNKKLSNFVSFKEKQDSLKNLDLV